MSRISQCRQSELLAELVGAALRYVAVADWFEGLPVNRDRKRGDRRAMEVFNHVETELRRAGAIMLRQRGHRSAVLEGVLREST